MNREINASGAFVAARLSGSEGAGVADILFGSREATGKPSFTWPATCEGNPLNSPDGAVSVAAGGEALDISDRMLVAEGKGWRDVVLTPDCLGKTGGLLTFSSDADFTIATNKISREESAAGTACSF